MNERFTEKMRNRVGEYSLPRRTVLKGAAAVGLFSTVPWSVGRVRAQATPSGIPVPTDARWTDPLPRPDVVEPVSKKGGVDYYEIPMTEFQQQVLPTAMGDVPTTLWGYGGTYPGATIEARVGREVRVKWMNQLGTDYADNDRVSHLLSVDKRVHGAETEVPEIRTVTHLHGGVTPAKYDGYPEAWVTPDGETTDDFDDIPDSPVAHEQTKTYPNRQEPGTLWYHDHALGITRLNVYAGLAGFYLLRGEFEDQLPNGKYEIPILLQDRSFDENGELFYPPGTNVTYDAEFWGDVPVVNGKAYPYLEVEPREYRFRFLNGSNGRSFNLKLYNEDTGSYGAVPTMEQIGVDLGYLDDVVTVGPDGMVPSLLLSGAERADVVVDFGDFEGETFMLRNGAGIPYAGEPFDDGVDMVDMLQIRVTAPLSEPGKYMPRDKFLRVVNRRIRQYDFVPDPIEDIAETRRFTLDSTGLNVADGVTYDTHFLDLSLWSDEAAVVKPKLGTAEVWEFVNMTGDSHPIHLHLVDVDVLERVEFRWLDEEYPDYDDGAAEAYGEAAEDYVNGEGNATRPEVLEYVGLTGVVNQPTPNNAVKKDTVLVNPNEMLRVKVDFTGFAGRYEWHCHILEHEDQEMMLPFEVVE